jgi:hypothetical protein
VNRVSYNGGHGVQAGRRTAVLAAREPHRALTEPQRPAASARALPSSLASVNHGHPQVAATPRPGVFSGQGVAAPRYANRAWAPSSHPTLSDRSHGEPDSEHGALFASMNTRSRSPATEQDRTSFHMPQHPTAPAAQHGGFGPSTVRSPGAQSMRRWRLFAAASSRPAQPYRVAHPTLPRQSQAVVPAPRNASGYHNEAQPPHVNHRSPHKISGTVRAFLGQPELKDLVVS